MILEGRGCSGSKLIQHGFDGGGGSGWRWNKGLLSRKLIDMNSMKRNCTSYLPYSRLE